jgi:multiple sugar transport system substrate-binding protein
MRKLSLLAAASLAGACSSSTNEGPTSVELTFLQHDNPAYRKADGVAFTAYTAAHPTVTFKPTSVDYATLTSTLVAQLKTNSLNTDIVRIPPSWVCSFADNLADVPASVASLGEAQSAFFAAPLSGATCKGTLKGLPMEYNLEYGGVVVNLDKYQAKAGKAGMEPSWASWDAFIDDAAGLAEFDGTKPVANGLDIDPGWPQPAKHIFFSQILQRGGNYWSPSADTFDFGTPAAKASLQAMVDWVKVKKVMSSSLIPAKNTFVTTRLATGATGYGWDDVTKPLSVIGYVGTWGLTDTKGQIPAGANTKYGFYILPPMVGTEHKFVQNSGWALAVPKSSTHQAAAWDFIKSLAMSGDAMKAWSATTGALPALKVNGTAAAAAADPLLAKVQPLLEHGQWVGYIPATAIETVEGAIVSNFFAAANDMKSVDQALKDMQKTANDALAAAAH